MFFSRITRSAAALPILIGAMMIGYGADASFAPLPEKAQRELVGGGPDYSCSGVGSCTACVAPSGCTYWEWGGIFWGCDCTSPGSGGCETTGVYTWCDPEDGQTCNETGGGASCGNEQEPDDQQIKNVGGAWTCDPQCIDSEAGLHICTKCSS